MDYGVVLLLVSASLLGIAYKKLDIKEEYKHKERSIRLQSITAIIMCILAALIRLFLILFF